MTKGSVFSMGGGGTVFENYIQTSFLTSMIVKSSFPGFKDSYILKMALQAKRLGYETDDIVLKIQSGSIEHTVLVQIKHELSFTLKDKVFEDVLSQFWTDFKNKELFDIEKDRFYVIKQNLNKKESSHVRTITNWAKAKSSFKDFELEIERIEAKQSIFNIFKKVLNRIDKSSVSNEEVFRFLKC